MYHFAIFEYMIGNTDWSMVYQHNVEMLYLNSAAFAIPYDFDHSGIVNAYYAKPNPMLNIRSVRDRIYRGMCRKDPLIFEKMRQYYVSKIDDVSSVLEKYKGIKIRGGKLLLILPLLGTLGGRIWAGFEGYARWVAMEE